MRESKKKKRSICIFFNRLIEDELPSNLTPTKQSIAFLLSS